MRIFFCFFLFMPFVAEAGVAEDINVLLDKFFGGDQAPLEDKINTEETFVGNTKNITETKNSLKNKEDNVGVKREIMQKEAELASFETELRALELGNTQLHSQLLTNQQQLDLVDQQLGLNARKLFFYKKQTSEWKKLVETLTREKSVLRAELRILEREYKSILSKNFIRKQNFELNPTLGWWQWLLSEKSVSELLSDRKKVTTQQQEKSFELKRLEKLKQAYEKQEIEAVKALATVEKLNSQLAKEQIVLADLAEAKAHLLKNLTTTNQQKKQQLHTARQAQAEITRYLQTLRNQLQNSDFDIKPSQVVLSWPLVTPVTITSTFKDEGYRNLFDREHLGLDLATDQGSNILAAGEGIISKVATDGTGYTYIIVQHSAELYTVYGHLSKTLVKLNEPVAAGQVIAWSGGTPGTPGAGYFTSGPHLHFEVFSNGQFVDPLSFLPVLEAKNT